MSKILALKNSALDTQKECSSETRSNFLDPNKTNSNNADSAAGTTPSDDFCGQYLLTGPRGDDGLYPHLKIFCNRYGCHVCGKRKRFIVSRAIEQAMVEHKLDVFATLTLAPGNCDPNDSAKYIKKVWNKHRTYQRREFSPAPSFVSIVEFQKNGNAHLHVLFSHYIPHSWLRDSWVAVGGGSIVDVRRADTHASQYMAKYLSKEMEKERYGNFRRVCSSRDIKLLAKNKNPEFQFLNIEYFWAKDMLGPAVKENIQFGKTLITGFRASRRLQKA